VAQNEDAETEWTPRHYVGTRRIKNRSYQNLKQTKENICFLKKHIFEDSLEGERINIEQKNTGVNKMP
jgi:hypothetical protein